MRDPGVFAAVRHFPRHRPEQLSWTGHSYEPTLNSDINELQVFEWSLERRSKGALRRTTCEDLTTLKRPWPPEATEWLGQVLKAERRELHSLLLGRAQA